MLCLLGVNPIIEARGVIARDVRWSFSTRRTTLAGNSTESGRSVTSKITSILLAFTQGSEHSLTEIACLAGLPVSTAHRLISELTTRRLLERTDDGLYRVGLPLRMISAGESCVPSLQER